MKKISAARRQSRVAGPVTLAVYTVSILSPMLVAVPASAQSDVDVRDMTVEQRPRETYDARGVSVGGGFTFLPSLTVNENYDDNIFGGPVKTSDFITVINPKVALKSNWSRHSLEFEAYGRFNRFADHTEQNSDEYGASTALALDVAHGGAFNFNGSYDRLTVDRKNIVPFCHFQIGLRQWRSQLRIPALRREDPFDPPPPVLRHQIRAKPCGAIRIHCREITA